MSRVKASIIAVIAGGAALVVALAAPGPTPATAPADAPAGGSQNHAHGHDGAERRAASVSAPEAARAAVPAPPVFRRETAPEEVAEEREVRADAVAYHAGRTNAFFDASEFRKKFREAEPQRLSALRAALLDPGSLDELPAAASLAADPPVAVTDRMAMLDLMGELSGEDDDALAALVDIILAPIDVRKPDHVKRVLLVEKYEALSHLAHKNWERARSVFARIGGEGLRDALRPALIEGLAAGGVPYEQAAAMAAES